MFKCFNLRFVLKYHTDWQRNTPINYSIPSFSSFVPFHAPDSVLLLMPIVPFPSIPRSLTLVVFHLSPSTVFSPCSVSSVPFYSTATDHCSVPSSPSTRPLPLFRSIQSLLFHGCYPSFHSTVPSTAFLPCSVPSVPFYSTVAMHHFIPSFPYTVFFLSIPSFPSIVPSLRGNLKGKKMV